MTNCEILTFNLSGQLFGIPVLQVNDVLGPQKITHTPLAPRAVSGIMNLRGRIVTAIEVRRCLGQQERDVDQKGMSVVVDHNGELFSLIVDEVGDVLNLGEDTYEDVPATLPSLWRQIASGIHKLDKQILIVLDVKQLLQISVQKEGAYS